MGVDMRKSLLKTISMILIFVILLASPILSAELGAIEKSKLLDEGEKVIRDFYNPKSANYYGKKEE